MWLLGALLHGCAGVVPGVGPRRADDAVALEAATASFYGATTAEALQAAVDQAARAGPDTGRFHELAASHAFLQGRLDEAFEHVLLALQDTGYDAASVALVSISPTELSFAHRERLAAVLRELLARHPQATVRDEAAILLARLADEEGRWTERDALVTGLPGRLALSVVGPFDNDQGRAWETELEPERHTEPRGTYQGRFGPLAWQPAPPKTTTGNVDLAEAMAPTEWQVAYARAEVITERARTWRLSVTTTDNLKVWVDGRLVVSTLCSAAAIPDFVDVPLELPAGTHRFLFKSANASGTWWRLGARLTPLEGEGTPPGGAPVDGARLARWAMRRLEGPSNRVRTLTAEWAWYSAGGRVSVEEAERAMEAAPGGIVAGHRYFEALWFNGDTGRAGDVIAELSRAHGAALPMLTYRRARFQSVQGFPQQGRELLAGLVGDAPWLRYASSALADDWEKQEWFEDALNLRDRLAARFPPSIGMLEERAALLDKLKRRRDATAAYEDLRARFPGRRGNLDTLARLAVEAGELDRAAALTRERLRHAPDVTAAWLDLADYALRRGQDDELESALATVERLRPGSAEPLIRRGLAASSRADTGTAVRHWRRALALNPDQPRLASRIDELDPASRAEWLRDVPRLDALIATARQPLADVGNGSANVAYVVDEEVVLLSADGSTSRVVTQVIRALTTKGVDTLLSQKLRSGGTLRLLAAFSVDDQGVITQANERSREILFRALRPGSTVVLQYRLDAAPQGYLGAYLTDSFTFQGTRSRELSGRYVLWLPSGTALRQVVTGQVDFSRDARGALERLEWSTRGLEPLPVEPDMPPSTELAAAVRVTTIPDWKTWTAWWQAILDGAFRESAELRALGDRLSAGAATPEEKLERIHEWVQEEVRYQQDYESFIAGVKPHPAPMVLERRYGDCKDKAVLFVQLARQLGLEARVALVLTRDRGAVLEALPMQQFNHAIVYVPAQAGLAAPRFFDPTSTSFDLGHLPATDVGSRALVLEPASGSFEWHDVPQLSADLLEVRVEATARDDGSATGSIDLRASGGYGAWLRRLASDPELPSTVANISTALAPGATVEGTQAIEARSIRRPAHVRARLESKELLRRDGDGWRLRPPTPLPVAATSFSLAERKWELRPVVSTVSVEARVTLPPGLRPAQELPPIVLELPCLRSRNELRVDRGVVVATSTVETRCASIPAEEYPRYRALYFQHLEAARRELVLKRAK